MDLNSALPVSGSEDWEQLQCGCSEAALHEQGQQAAAFSLQIDPFHEGQGNLCLVDEKNKN